MALSRRHRIIGDKDFNHAFRYGRVVSGRGMIAKAIPNKLNRLRFGVAVSVKKFPLAVMRSKVKRMIFSRLANLVGNSDLGYDIIFVPQAAGNVAQEVGGLVKKIVDSSKA